MRIIEVSLRQDYSTDWVTIKCGNGETYVLSNEHLTNALIETDQMCAECEDTGEIFVDEYENGQLVGPGTISKPCVCRLKQPSHEGEN